MFEKFAFIDIFHLNSGLRGDYMNVLAQLTGLPRLTGLARLLNKFYSMYFQLYDYMT